MLREWGGLAVSSVLILIIFACTFPGLFTSCEPNLIALDQKLQPPSSAHILGTDEMGRDLLARVLYGGRVTIWSSLTIAAVSIFVATLWASISAYAGGIVDEVMTRIMDSLMNIPSLLFVLLLVSILDPGMVSLVIALSLIKWTGSGRIIRGQVLTLVNAEFILASRAIGGSPAHILVKHIVPNTWFLVVTLFGLNFGSSILSISSLNFLGFGVQLPNPEWGAMINYARTYLQTHPNLMLFPGLAIVLTILATNITLTYFERARGHNQVSYL